MPKSKKLLKCRRCLIPQRYLTAVMLQLAIIFTILINRAIEKLAEGFYETWEAPRKYCDQNKSHPLMQFVAQRPANWPTERKEYANYIYFICRMSTELFAGVWADRYGGKHILELSALALSGIGLCTPILIQITQENAFVFYILNGVEGLIVGIIFPSLSSILSFWCPPSERATIGSIVFSGYIFGLTVNYYCTYQLIEKTNNWAIGCYVFSGCFLAWVIIWQLLFKTNYEDSKWISLKEMRFLKKEIGDNVTLGKKIIPWRKICLSPAIISACLLELCRVLFDMIRRENFPNEIQSKLGVDFLASRNILGRVSLITGVAAILSGILMDFLVARKYVTSLSCVKIYSTLSVMGAPIFYMVSYFSDCDKVSFYILTHISFFFIGLFYPSISVNVYDLAPNFSGTIKAIFHIFNLAFGRLPGLYFQYKDDHLSDEKYWPTFVWVSYGLFAVLNVVYVIFASTELQSWNTPRFKKPPVKTSTLELSITQRRKSLHDLRPPVTASVSGVDTFKARR